MATVAIGDIHGQVKPLCDLLERVRPNIGAGDTVVFLGDYIDRGRDTKACIDAILEFTASVPAAVVCLRGNHEAWMLETRDDHTRHAWLLGMKALTTIRSYSAAAAEAIGAAAAGAAGAAGRLHAASASTAASGRRASGRIITRLSLADVEVRRQPRRRS